MAFFIGILCALVLLCCGVHWTTRGGSDSRQSCSEFKKFQRTYIAVYLFATGTWKSAKSLYTIWLIFEVMHPLEKLLLMKYIEQCLTSIFSYPSCLPHFYGKEDDHTFISLASSPVSLLPHFSTFSVCLPFSCRLATRCTCLCIVPKL